jgi:hypothetical protein
MSAKAARRVQPCCPHCGNRKYQRYVTDVDGTHELWTCENPTSQTTVYRGPRSERKPGVLQMITLEGCGSYTRVKK